MKYWESQRELGESHLISRWAPPLPRSDPSCWRVHRPHSGRSSPDVLHRSNSPWHRIYLQYARDYAGVYGANEESIDIFSKLCCCVGESRAKVIKKSCRVSLIIIINTVTHWTIWWWLSSNVYLEADCWRWQRRRMLTTSCVWCLSVAILPVCPLTCCTAPCPPVTDSHWPEYSRLRLTCRAWRLTDPAGCVVSARTSPAPTHDTHMTHTSL